MKNLYNIIGNNLFLFLILPYILLFCFILFLYRYRKNKADSISKCIASSKKSYYFFIVFLFIGSLPVYTTFIFYLIPKYNGNILTVICILLVYLLQSLFTLFPDKNKFSLIHTFFAFSGGFMTILFCLLLAITGTIGINQRVLLIQFVIIVSSLLLFLLFSKKANKYVFGIEVMFLLEWITTIFTLIFV